MTSNETIRTNQTIHKHVGAAAAGVWVAAIAGIAWMTVAWAVWLVLLHVQPAWVLSMWGGGELTWDEVRLICIGFFGLFKLFIFAVVLVAICLTVWSRCLKKCE